MFHRPLSQYCSCHAAQARNGQQRELKKSILQNMFNNLTPQTVHILRNYELWQRWLEMKPCSACFCVYGAAGEVNGLLSR